MSQAVALSGKWKINVIPIHSSLLKQLLWADQRLVNQSEALFLDWAADVIWNAMWNIQQDNKWQSFWLKMFLTPPKTGQVPGKIGNKTKWTQTDYEISLLRGNKDKGQSYYRVGPDVSTSSLYSGTNHWGPTFYSLMMQTLHNGWVGQRSCSTHSFSNWKNTKRMDGSRWQISCTHHFRLTWF